MLLSICIPTYNRADILEHCLTRLIQDLDFLWGQSSSCEIVVSDNASTDHTQKVLAGFCDQGLIPIRAVRQKVLVSPEANMLNAFYQARGKYVVYLADDDALIVSVLFDYLKVLEAIPDEVSPPIVSLYADWVAWDDAKGEEIHRYLDYGGLKEIRFDSRAEEAPIVLLNFVLRQLIYPEIAIHHRESFLKSHCWTSRCIPHHLWMYQQFRRGMIVFSQEPFYRENRILKPHLRRVDLAENTKNAHRYIGDEMRNTLETIALWALRDSGQTYCPESMELPLKRMIDRFLHMRTFLEIQRAMRGGDALLALDLVRRMELWYAPRNSREGIIGELSAEQASRMTYDSLTHIGAGDDFYGKENYKV